MIERVILVCIAGSLGVAGCGSGDDPGGVGGDAGGGGGDAGGAGGVAGAGGSAGVGGAGGTGGQGGQGGFGGFGRTFTSASEQIDAGLVYQRELCQCQDGPALISESACLALAQDLPFPSLPLSDRQNECFDEVVLGEEQRTLENRLACFVDVDLTTADCIAAVNECSETAIDDCREARTEGRGGCPGTAVNTFQECFRLEAVDGVDAFLDSREARCECLTDCANAERDPDDVECMVGALQDELDALGPQGPAALLCITPVWRREAVCFGNETSCDGLETACDDLPATSCAIDRALLFDCLGPQD